MLKENDSLIPYLLWKITTNNIRQKEHKMHCFKNIMYDLKNEDWNVDNFLEIRDKTKTELYLFYITFLIHNDLISELKIRILDDNNPYKTEDSKNGNDFLNLHLDININKGFLEKNNNIFPNFHGINDNKNKQEYNKFIGGFYSIKETLKLNNLDNGNIRENFHIYFIYKPNLDNIHKYIEEYLLEWGNERLTPPDNYIKPSMQIQYFRNYIIEQINNYGDEFIYHIGTNSKLDEITLILYYNITGYISLSAFDDGVDRIMHGLQNKNKNFKIKILQKFFDDFTKKEGISFDEKSGKVFIDGENIGTINIDTQRYHFFKFLLDNRGKYKTHLEIKEYIKGRDSIEKTPSGFCAEVKRELPLKIRELVKSQKGGYLIP